MKKVKETIHEDTKAKDTVRTIASIVIVLLSSTILILTAYSAFFKN